MAVTLRTRKDDVGILMDHGQTKGVVDREIGNTERFAGDKRMTCAEYALLRIQACTASSKCSVGWPRHAINNPTGTVRP